MPGKHLEAVVKGGDILGEVPLWCDRSKLLWWVDVRRPALQSWDPSSGEHSCYTLPDGFTVGSWAFRESGGTILATNKGFFSWDIGSEMKALVNPESDKPDNRLNDGRVDRRGRFWCGSMHDTIREPAGSLYRLDPDMAVTRHLDNIILPNSINWSPDSALMYFADTTRQVIFIFDFDLDDGTISGQRLLKDLRGNPGRPDGSAVDETGCIWNAEYAGGRVVRYAPDGRELDAITLPVTQVTSCCFGGSDLSTLFITTASQRLTPDERSAQPLAGALFAIDVETKGMPEARFKG